ncbi:MAG: hypothetical protein OEW17_04525 [Gemmatimonadota bacterium]|nr:hypothetical protein [Gemmatimonadota bacterium]MDH4348048.1 hypothetical protein [Gemmatimonadota bacterium]MDH5282635.1 hypothetical protein [Gemmatimonadota bacterium]
MQGVAGVLVRAASWYGVAGLLFGIWFAWRGAGQVDPVARAGSPGFRLLILPGAALLWPWLAVRLLRGEGRAA